MTFCLVNNYQIGTFVFILIALLPDILLVKYSVDLQTEAVDTDKREANDFMNTLKISINKESDNSSKIEALQKALEKNISVSNYAAKKLGKYFSSIIAHVYFLFLTFPIAYIILFLTYTSLHKLIESTPEVNIDIQIMSNLSLIGIILAMAVSFSIGLMRYKYYVLTSLNLLIKIILYFCVIILIYKYYQYPLDHKFWITLLYLNIFIIGIYISHLLVLLNKKVKNSFTISSITTIAVPIIVALIKFVSDLLTK